MRTDERVDRHTVKTKTDGRMDGQTVKGLTYERTDRQPSSHKDCQTDLWSEGQADG